MYASLQRRKAAERIEATRLALVQGLWANSNYDDEKNTRENAVERITQESAAALQRLYAPAEDLSTEIDMTDPFFAAMKVPELPKEMSAADEQQLTAKDIDLDQI